MYIQVKRRSLLRLRIRDRPFNLYKKMNNNNISNVAALIKTCGDCPYAQKSRTDRRQHSDFKSECLVGRISKVLYTCSLWGGVVKESDRACVSVGGKA